MNQDEAIAFLSAGASYGLPGAPVERVETHCSIVFLVADRAYKLKRAVAFSALDYTSLEKREFACRREVALNRRTAPTLYLAARAIRRTPLGVLQFDGTGELVDWVVVMRRFDQAGLFDRLADADRLTPALMGALADEIVRFHTNAAPTAMHDGASGLKTAIEHNRSDHESVAALLGPRAIADLYAASLAALARVETLLDARRDSGKARRCHGDLRLANICLYEGRPTLFDAIEFSDAIACIDVLFDLAFLIIDLVQRELAAAANLVFNRYLDRTGDEGGLAAFPLMLSIRAATRAYSLAASSQRVRHPQQSARLAAEATSFMTRAVSLLAPARPRVAILGGEPAEAALKAAAALAPGLGACPGARIIGDPAPPESVLETILAAGYSVVVAAPDAADKIARLARRHDVPFDEVRIAADVAPMAN